MTVVSPTVRDRELERLQYIEHYLIINRRTLNVQVQIALLGLGNATALADPILGHVRAGLMLHMFAS